MIVSVKLTIWGLVLGIAAAYVCSASLGTYYFLIAGLVGVNIIVAVGLNLLTGNAGLVSLATPAFVGIGAYGVIIGMTRWHLPMLVAAAGSIVVAICTGWVIGLISLRLEGFYLALVTFGFLASVQYLLTQGGPLVGSGYGLVAPPGKIGSWLISPSGWAFVAIVCGVLVAIMAASLRNSRIGRSWELMRSSGTAAELFGINLITTKTNVFALSAGLAATSGVVFAFLQLAVSPAQFTIGTAFEQLTYIVFGGLGSAFGSVLGTVLLVSLPEALRGFDQYRPVIFGLALLVILIVSPSGLAGLFRRAWQAVRATPTVAVLPSVRHLSRHVLSGEDQPAIKLAATDGRGAALAPRAPTTKQADGSSAGSDPTAVNPGAASVGLALEAVTVSFGGLTALDRLSFSIASGELHGLIGPNGAGKTTAINVITGVVVPTLGEVRMAGAVISNSTTRIRSRSLIKRGVTRTFQTPILAERMTALENVAVGLHADLNAGLVRCALRTAAMRAAENLASGRARQALLDVGFGLRPEQPCSSLGLSDRRRVELARALVSRPRLLLLDEPTSGLELDEAEAAIETIRSIQAARVGHPLTVLFVEHNVPLIFNHCDRVTAMDRGTAVVSDIPEVVAANERVRESYLGIEVG